MSCRILSVWITLSLAISSLSQNICIDFHQEQVRISAFNPANVSLSAAGYKNLLEKWPDHVRRV